MKFIAILCFVLFVNHAAANCRNDCYNQWSDGQCALMSSFCSTRNSIKNIFCRKTCNTCTTCLVPALSTTCEEGCRDVYHPVLCLLFKVRTNGCIYASQVCRATCGFCQGCLLPPGDECTKDCKNTNENCAYWKKKGFCDPKKKFPHVQNVCPLECGICKPCPTEEPNTALPPTKKEDEQKTAKE